MTKTGSGFIDSSIEQVLGGRLTEIPEPPSNCVNIYVASTGEDFRIERERLWEVILPELQSCLIPHGIDVQFIDYHHEAYIDHAYDRALFEKHLEKLVECSKTSMGPFFLCLIGNKHGLVPLPAYIEEYEYNHLKHEASQAGKDIQLLDKWYVKETDTKPVVYTLKKLDKHYSTARQVGYLSEDDLKDWKETFHKLQDLLQYSASVCYKEGRINQIHEYKQQRYFMSTVEQEIQEALQLSLSNCLVVDRHFDFANERGGDMDKYVDMKANGAVNTEAQKRLRTLKDILTPKLNANNMLTYSLPWKERGLSPETCHQHAVYLEQFQTSVVSKLVDMVEKYMETHPEFSTTAVTDMAKRDMYGEVRSHVILYQGLSATKVYGFEEIEEHLRKLLMKGYKHSHQGILIHGGDGSGKQTIATRVCSIAQEVLGKDCLVVIRYAGMTSSCRTVHGLLLSLCSQLHHMLKLNTILTEFDTKQLMFHFHGILNHLARAAFRSTVIVIDGLHRLKPAIAGQKADLDWLATELLPKVHLILTMSDAPRYSDQLETFRDNFVKGEGVLQIPTLELKHAKGIARYFAAAKNRTCSVDEENTILELCKSDLRPLAIHMCTEHVLEQSNATHNRSSSHSLQQWIQDDFGRLEKRYGPLLMSNVSRYISAANYGLSEMELLDLLSCNNKVLLSSNKDLYIDGTGACLRFPVWILHSILSDMKHLLRILFINGKPLINWSHSIILKLAIQRYKSSVEEIKQAHRDIADLFTEKWVGNKPLIAPRDGLNIIDTGCRFVCQQPLLYSDTKYNYRRLGETWFHLLHTGDIDSFKEHTLCNFEYLLATAHSMGLNTLLYEFDMTVGHVLDVDLHLVQRCITLAKDVLRRDPIQLASELIGRLRQIKEYSPVHIETLVQQCMEWCDSHTKAILVPLSSWQPDPRNELVSTLRLNAPVKLMCPTPNSQHVFCCMRGTFDILMYHFSSNRLIRKLKGHKVSITCMMVSRDSRFLYSGSADSMVYVWNVADGSIHHVFKEHSDAVLCFVQKRRNNELITGCKDKCFRVINVDMKHVLHTKAAHDAGVTCMALTKGDTMLVTGSADQQIKVWYLEDMSLVNTIENGISSPVVSLALTVDNTFLMIGTQDGAVLVKAFTTGTDGHRLDAHTGKASSIIVSKDSHHCLISTEQGQLYAYNFRTRNILHTYDCATDQSPCTSCHVSKDENFIFSSAGDTINVWTFFKESTKALANDNHSDIVTCVAISRDGKMGISGSRDSHVKLWNLEISDLVSTWEGHDAQVTCVDIAEHDAFALSGSEDTTVKVWSIIMGCVITDYKGHRSTVMHVVAMLRSIDNFHVMSAEEDGLVHLWQAEDGVSLLICDSSVTLLAVAPSMQIAVSGPGNSCLQLWRIEDGTLVGGDVRHSDNITCVEFSADSQYLVTGSADCSLKVWEARTGKLTQVLVEHSQPVTCGSITEDNYHIVSGSYDQKVLVWGLETGAVEHQLTGHTDRITCLRVTKEASTAISGSKDGTLRVWNILLGLPITTFDVHYSVHDIQIMSTANRIMLQLERSNYVPILCLHNSPAEMGSSSHCMIKVTGSGDSLTHNASETYILPIKPKPLIAQRPNKIYLTSRTGMISRQSVSSIPEIIKVSPMKAPLQTTIKAQEIHKEKRSMVVKMDFSSQGSASKNKTKEKREKKSSTICVLL